ncbi:MAG: four helix bundle protein [Chthoniobacterales bacterium]|nr:four helix bundle protein [Chthoniobacterales bacterium]
MDKAELLARTKTFSLRIFKLVDQLPNGIGSRAIAQQVVRSGTAIGANYRAACRGRSTAEFAAKLGVVAEEADETVYWLELVRDGGFMAPARIDPLLAEANELTAIFTAARRTASKSNLKPQPSNIPS